MGHLVINDGGQTAYFNGAKFVSDRKSRVVLTRKEAAQVQLDWDQMGQVRFVKEVGL